MGLSIRAYARHRGVSHAAYAKIVDTLHDIEREWAAELGPRRFNQLKALLVVLWNSPLVR